jgi:hypothetical protein
VRRCEGALLGDQLDTRWSSLTQDGIQPTRPKSRIAAKFQHRRIPSYARESGPAEVSRKGKASSPKSARNPPGNQLDWAIHAAASASRKPSTVPHVRSCAYSAPPQDLLRARASPRRAKTRRRRGYQTRLVAVD